MKDGKTTEETPCHYRCKGLVVIDSTRLMQGPKWDARKENGWMTDEAWGVTHELSGASVCIWETKTEALAAAQVLIAIARVDWTKDMDTVRKAVMASPTARKVVAALKQGNMTVSTVPMQKPGVA